MDALKCLYYVILDITDKIFTFAYFSLFLLPGLRKSNW